MCNRAQGRPRKWAAAMGAHRAHLLLLWRGFVCLTLQSLHPQPGPKGSQLRVLRGTGVPSGSEARSTGDSGGLLWSWTLVGQLFARLVARRPYGRGGAGSQAFQHTLP